ncbi:MAG TPA: thiamine pyrophosphate-binding protein [Desulfomonilaceae bacterium]|nr:thiamine pyrophosphate-binding protein [Desulfomonilaceae bacterium]
MKGTHYILKALAAEGIEALFFVPGGLIDPFLSAFEDTPQIRPIVAAQEGGACYMADGYSRASGNFGACLAIGGPGLTNMTTAVSTAWTDESPLLVLSGEVATFMEGLGGFQDASASSFNDTEILRSVTAMSLSIENPHLLNHHFREALLTMFGRCNRPVHLSLPRDLQEAEISVAHVPLDRSLIEPKVLDSGAADRFWARVAPGRTYDKRADKIAILAGYGAERSNASKALLGFAETFHIPVATTLKAKGVFPEDHPLSLGVFGYAGTRHASAAILSDDLEFLLVLGSGLNERDTMHWNAKLASQHGLFQVDMTPEASSAVYGGAAAVIGDVSAFIERIMSEPGDLLAHLDAGKGIRDEWINGIRKAPRLYDAENCSSDAIPIHPARIISELRRAMPRETVALVDSGAHRAFAGQYWESYEPRTYISATNLGPMGWAIPAGIGVKIARPDRPCVVITGDGCMLMHGLEIQTAARFDVPVIYVVINNSAFGNVWLRASKIGPKPSELTSLPDHDWAGLAKALGLKSVTVRKPQELAPAFHQALEAKSAFLVDVKADKRFGTPVEPFTESIKSWSYHE